MSGWVCRRALAVGNFDRGQSSHRDRFLFYHYRLPSTCTATTSSLCEAVIHRARRDTICFIYPNTFTISRLVVSNHHHLRPTLVMASWDVNRVKVRFLQR